METDCADILYRSLCSLIFHRMATTMCDMTMSEMLIKSVSYHHDIWSLVKHIPISSQAFIDLNINTLLHLLGSRPTIGIMTISIAYSKVYRSALNWSRWVWFIILVQVPPIKRNVDPMLGNVWASIAVDVLTLHQHWCNASCLLLNLGPSATLTVWLYLKVGYNYFFNYRPNRPRVW